MNRRCPVLFNYVWSTVFDVKVSYHFFLSFWGATGSFGVLSFVPGLLIPTSRGCGKPFLCMLVALMVEELIFPASGVLEWLVWMDRAI